MEKANNSGDRQVFSSTLALHSGKHCREVSLILEGKRVISASVENPSLGNVAVKQNHNQIQHPSDTTSNKEVFEEQKIKDTMLSLFTNSVLETVQLSA